jgi:hypothetical protein
MLASLNIIANNTSGLAVLLARMGIGTNNISGTNIGFKQDIIGDTAEVATRTALAVVTAGMSELLGFGRTIGNMVGSLFGTKTSIKGQGISANGQTLESILNGGFQAQYYTDVETKKKFAGLTTSTNRKTVLQEADIELERQFGLIFKNVADSIVSASDPLGISLDTVLKRLNGFVVNIGRINLQGLSGTQIQETLTAVFGKAGDEVAKAVLPGLEDFQKIGEGYYETVVRVASGVEEADLRLSGLGIQMKSYNNLLNKQGDVAAELVRESILAVESLTGISEILGIVDGTASELVAVYTKLTDIKDTLSYIGVSTSAVGVELIRGAGGFESFEEALSSFQENFLTESQRLDIQTAKMTKQFQALGLTIPKSAAEYVTLVQGIDTSSESGKILLGRVLGLSDGFSEVTGSIEDAAEAMEDFKNNILEYIRSLNQEEGTATSGYGFSRNQYYMNLQQAGLGNLTSMENLTDYADQYLTATKSIAGTAFEYEKAVGLVKNDLLSLVDGDGLGNIVPTSSTIQDNNLTNATISSANDSKVLLQQILTKLESMDSSDRAEMQASVTHLSTLSKILKRAEGPDHLRTQVVNTTPINVDVV